MLRDPCAYLNDILEAAAAIAAATSGLDEGVYSRNRLVRSATEREFILIGEALKMIAQRDPRLFAAIPEGCRIIDFRNLLTHAYLNVSDRIVWGAISGRSADPRSALHPTTERTESGNQLITAATEPSGQHP
ncbi:MAG: DUF86 domain-containing protein [Synechococcus sp. SB0668_bin_15]|nr:DUF86 domain-containing protein [Synechococcus sp. SB0668_bin_15]MXZ83943.1 DUF86 domain-containing protein [Synechococcus sp. SB0666_bin_14]MYA91394.1 DUF86 domain-containing protein [Synechococcus sp. SB0663_bin_10]MYC49998.1 DUF86 domain-containing protein [Synechococcus sp. SB0662_bin_14]MYG47338.1 DUF86 domain-containing protein [Synechococcus sp. SB0675_bin_6]MYJ59078.1 DUF86 domain-containing protein [Synechococcus sp. SB0672_bin_6]MYK92233.1 DUF86 domain-containing protein [Synecho